MRTGYCKRSLMIACGMALIGMQAGTGTVLASSVEHGYDAALVLPAKGHYSRVAFGESLMVLVREGVLDPRKIDLIYAPRGGVPADMAQALREASHRPIRVTRENADLVVTLLWAVGLANYMSANERSPLKSPHLARFASTGGWTLGHARDGAAYFNRFAVVPLAPEQEALVERVARSTFRPCCNNSTFFQDCNHGSALLGLLALGAAQGLNEPQLYQEALAFNSFWFPATYVHLGLYFKAVTGTQWTDVYPQEAMSARFSSAAGWRANVRDQLERRGLLPAAEAASCSI